MHPFKAFLLALAAACGAFEGLQAQVLINEVLASNRLTIRDDDGDSSDWVELYNPGSDAIDLPGHALSDDPRQPRKWVIPNGSIAAGGYVLVWCSGKDRAALSPEQIARPNSPLLFEPALVDLDADWRYLIGAPADSGPPLEWNDAGFDDSSWPHGKPGFGFGEGDEVTVLPEGIGAVFLRHVFYFNPSRPLANLVFQARYDDGFVLYLNGVRVLASNFGDAEPTFASTATRARESRDGIRFDLTPVLATLEPGANVIAAALLNSSPLGDDLSFIPELGAVLGPIHASFSLDAGGETLLLTRPDGGVEDSVHLPPQLEDQTYGRAPEAPGEFRYLLTPTPLAANAGPSSPEPLVVADTKFSVDRGFFEAPFSLEIRTETPGAEVRYTLDGTWPTATTGLIYSGSISVSRTTIVRAAAFKAGLKPTNADTHTYIFLEDVIRQTPETVEAAGFPAQWGNTPADYGMDPDVVGQDGSDKYGGKYAATIRDDLKAVPTMSIVMDMQDLFGPQGIYTNSEARGIAWERPASAELIHPGGDPGFQVDAGLRMHGGAFRSHGLTRKHSLRLVFKTLYGPGKLKHPLFGYKDAVDEFDTLVLRANANDGWQWDAADRRALYIRDSFGRETSLDMGAPASHEKFVHVYLNGAYWGLYDCVERPDASFSASYFGGDKDEWDAVSNDTVSNGDFDAWNTMKSLAARGLGTSETYQAIQGNNPDGSDNPNLESYLDAANLIDYMIVNLYMGNIDWPHKNWWVGRRKLESTGFKFFMWDSEWSLGLESDLNTNQTGVNSGVAAPYAAAKANAEFRLQFADRVHRHFSSGGALHVDPDSRQWDPARPDSNRPAARFKALADVIDRAIVAESARWGDQHVAARPFTRDEHWQAERDDLLKSYFPQRSTVVLGQLRAAKLYPAVVPPSFNRQGGVIPRGFRLALHAAAGEIFYTTEGSDPRLAGGAIAPKALRAVPAAAVTLVASGAAARAHVPTDGSLGLDWTSPDFDDSGWRRGPTGVGYEGAAGYEDLIATDVNDLMFNVSPSVYVRIPFQAENPASIRFLTLRMKYDDGFAAYLNGVAVAARNTPEAPAWNARATRVHGDAQAVVFEDTDLSDGVGVLRPGRNVLAIHGLNWRPNDDDMLILPELVASRGAVEILLEATTLMRARARAGNEWSALNEAMFVVDTSLPLRVTEIMYHPDPPPAGSPNDADDFEFVELFNAGTKPLDLAGIRVEGGVRFQFSTDAAPVLAPRAFTLLVKDRDAFAQRYGPAGFTIAGEYEGKLGNGGDSLVLRGPLDEKLLELQYDDEWYAETDGGGHSLVITDASLRPEAWGDREAWVPSALRGGSPGAVDPAQTGETGWQLPGDANQDGRRNTSDSIRILLRLFGGFQGALPCEGQSISEGANLTLHDLDGDGKVNQTDAVFIFAYLFREGPPPALGPGCVRIPGCANACAR